jgi:hypothetical protein
MRLDSFFKKRAQVGLWVAVVLLAGSAAAFAQIATATLAGTVLDPQGAAVPNAVIRVTNPATDQERTANSDSQGNFTISQLAPTTYTVEVSAAGFANSRLSEITLSVGDRLSLHRAPNRRTCAIG